ncbi:MAG: TonB-dependent receptor [Sphingopyxis sp.]
MHIRNLFGASLLAMAVATPAWAQQAPLDAAEEEAGSNDIIVTAQRSSQRLQDVPIAVSAFSAEALEAQQIENTSDLQLTLPNVVFSKGQFTNASFTIRGIGDLCVGVSCDSATAIHLNDAPLFNTRLFETEFFDLQQVEVLRGPQGTLFGRNATSGVVNFRTARPELGEFGASGEFEYGNYNSIKAKGMVNLPIGETMAFRLAGTYLNRDGYTTNTFNNSRLDGRDLYGVRASLRWEPSDNTTVDLMGYYFRENDSRLRSQKQQCQRDPTGVLGCLNSRLDYDHPNVNGNFFYALTSREFFAARGLPTAFALGSIYGSDVFAGVTNPADPRVVNTASPATYFAEEYIGQLRIEHEFDGGISLSLAGNYEHVQVDSSQDTYLAVPNRAGFAPGLTALQLTAAGVGALPTYLRPVATALIPGGAAGVLCTSQPEETGTGAFGGHSVCGTTPLNFDRSNLLQSSWSAEAIISSDWDGPFNFLLGGIYANMHLTENSYYVNTFAIDYLSGILGAFTALTNPASAGGPLPPSYLATPFFRNNTDDFQIASYGIFGEAYYNLTDTLKVTLGLRYNDDSKTISARSTTASFLAPHGGTSAFASPFVGAFDADPATAGNQLFQNRNVSFSEWTGRAVVDWQVTPDNLLYASYSRGYKSGGINPPLQPIFAVSESFLPEFINAFEIGSKNQFGDLQLNVTAFYYQYQDLQLSRIVARTAVNDNVDANIYGLEAEAIIRPTRELAVNFGFSYLNTEVSSDKFIANPRDFGGGRSDAVIIKDLTNGANCAVAPTTPGNAAGANGFVNQVNTLINNINAPGNPLTTASTGGLQPGAGLRPTAPFPSNSGIASTGAFSLCAILANLAPSALGTAFGGIQVFTSGIPVNIRGNELPQAPHYKASMGIQYTIETDSGVSIVPRFDLTYTGDSYGSIFTSNVNEVDGFTQANAQLQVNGPDNRWFGRVFVQNIFNSDSITGQYVTDQSQGLPTNIFTLDPRRYGLAVGFRF